jgi:hypothetical protein
MTKSFEASVTIDATPEAVWKVLTDGSRFTTREDSPARYSEPWAAWLGSPSIVRRTGIDETTRVGGAVHFFRYDTTKITLLLTGVIFVVTVFRGTASTPSLRLRDQRTGRSDIRDRRLICQRRPCLGRRGDDPTYRSTGYEPR